MPDITHADLMALGQRIEDSTRREVDQLRLDVKEDIRQVHARVSELRDRQERSETSIGAVEKQVTAVRHDLAGHVTASTTFRELLTATREARPPALPPMPSRAFVGGVVAALMGLASLVSEFVHQYGGELFKVWFKRP